MSDKRARVRKRTSLPPADLWLTIAQFCELFQICEATYFNMKKRGLGPEETRFRTIVRISPSAVDEWRVRLREEQSTKAAKAEADRRSKLSSVAGKLALASLQHPRHVSKQRKREEAVA
jgi:hypothetical protein